MDYYFIGDPELVTAFRFIGIEGTAVADQAEAVAAFRKITEGWDETAGAVLPGGISGCRVLVITEETADWLGDLLVAWQLSDRYPLVVEIPGIMGRLAGRKTLVDSIREAIGVHV
ncbi:MAG: ATPase V [Treponema sp.]|nr:ATPase V [Treponema sp.]